ncbi:MAG: D-alanyl-D-alanine carboxypeptidase, partial [Acetatifactor sp.]|nr:D-alanyl-D-alanine carboxypeptidase [Acetatifactor sp.]
MNRKRVLRHYIVVICCLFMALQQITGYAQEPGAGELYAQAAVLMDADSGRVLYNKNGSQVLAMASTTKIMTCILTLELADLQETVEISSYAASMPKVKLHVQKGERYRLEDLLYSLMLESHNDAAVAIAEHVGRRYLDSELAEKSPADYTVEESKQAVAAFAALMNRTAGEIGCADTWFITPNGLDATQTLTLKSGETIEKSHSTTARDLASIMCYCIRRSPQRETFLRITQTPSHSFSIDNGRSFSCVNHNAFLQMMQGAISGKTGFTNQAGYCYVGALERDGKTLVVALLACGWPNNRSYKWSDTRLLMNYGLEEFTYRSLDEVAYDEAQLSQIPVLRG